MKPKFLIIPILPVLILVVFQNPLRSRQRVARFRDRDLIRVGISTNDFSSLAYKDTSITSDAAIIATIRLPVLK